MSSEAGHARWIARRLRTGDLDRYVLDGAATLLADLAAARAREQRLEDALERIAENAECSIGEKAVSKHVGSFCAYHLARAALAAEPAADDGIDRPNEWTASNVPKFAKVEPASAAADEPGERE